MFTEYIDNLTRIERFDRVVSSKDLIASIGRKASKPKISFRASGGEVGEQRASAVMATGIVAIWRLGR